MTKLLIGLLSLALVGTGGLVAAVGGFGEVDPAFAESTTTGTTTGDVAPRRTNDVAIVTTTATTPAATAADTSGPCDELEHADDARCVGNGREARRNSDDDRSGPGSGDGERPDDSSDDSGHGSDHDDD